MATQPPLYDPTRTKCMGQAMSMRMTFHAFRQMLVNGLYAGSHAFLSARIYAKWIVDKARLPLSREHYRLYKLIHRLCWRELREFPDLVGCRNYNDKIQWLKLFDQSPDIVRCSDKVLVRDYINERIGEDCLPRLYQVHEHFSQIDFNSLPQAFVIKVNHDSGTVILVRNKSEVDFKQLETRIEEALGKAYGWENGEWAYAYINPQVLVEEFIDPSSSKPPPDYKFHCVDGKIKWLQFIFDRGAETKEVIVDPCGRITDVHFDHNMLHSSEFLVPPQWDEMRDIAERLAEGFRYVRVDMYCTKEKVYAGEMTFFPLMGCYKGDGQRQLGLLLDFDRSFCRPPIISQLERVR